MRTLFLLLAAIALPGCSSSGPFNQEGRPLPFLPVKQGLVCTATRGAVPLHVPNPEYPKELRKERVSGIAVVKAVVGTDGRLRDFEPVKTDDPRLTELTISTISGWRYEPAQCDGVSVENYVTITSRFALN